MRRLGEIVTHRWVIVVSQIAIGLVFLASALAKIGEPASFARQIYYYRLIPFGLENLMAITLPWIELVLALALLVRWSPRAGAIVGAGLMGVFVLAVGAALARGLDIECGCFGTADASRVGWSKLIGNLGLLALAGIACLAPRAGTEPGSVPRASG